MPRFCSACGGAIGAHAPVACPVCGHEHWSNASPGGTALVVHDGRLLLVRRAHDPWRGLWCAPGGFCDGPEHPATAAERETLEETGLRVRVVGYLGVWVYEYLPGSADGVDPRYCAVSYYHAAPVQEVELACDPAEVAEARWFAPDELPAELAPPESAPRIYGAWREAIAAGRRATPLPDP